MSKTPESIAPAMELRVTTAGGDVHDYKTTPVDVWRAEKITGTGIAQGVQTFTGLAALAYSCAVRAGHAYRTRKSSTDEAKAFETWLEGVADVEVLLGDDEDPTPPTGEEVAAGS